MKKFVREFKEFALKGNMMDLAIGMIIGAAFTSIVNSLVNDMINPFLGLFTGQIDFSNLFLSLDGTEYATLEAAEAADRKRPQRFFGIKRGLQDTSFLCPAAPAASYLYFLTMASI